MKAAKIHNQEDLEKTFSIRIAVFVEEQGVAKELEIDSHEKEATHIALWKDNKIIGTARWRAVDSKAKFERICVLPEYRKFHGGKLLVEELEKLAKAAGFSQAILHGQVQAEKFYKKLGYKVTTEPYMEDGISHETFEKNL